MRDSRGRIQRSPAARRSFMASHPCPATGKTSGACKGYVIDHKVPLKRGGTDAAQEHAVADDGGGKGQGQDRISSRSR
jgi:hypothetical protein